MATDFLPHSEPALIGWSGNFKTKITASPTTVGLTALQATAYGTKHDAFVVAHTVATDPATRSPMNVELKNVAKANLIAESRLLAGVVQRFPGTTNAMCIDLGLTPRSSEPTPIPPPAIIPSILIKKVFGPHGHHPVVRRVRTEAPRQAGWGRWSDRPVVRLRGAAD